MQDGLRLEDSRCAGCTLRGWQMHFWEADRQKIQKRFVFCPVGKRWMVGSCRLRDALFTFFIRAPKGVAGK